MSVESNEVALYHLIVAGFADRQDVAVEGLKDINEFKQFLNGMCSSFPKFLVSVIDDHLEGDGRDRLLLDFLNEFVGAYLVASGIDVSKIKNNLINVGKVNPVIMH